MYALHHEHQRDRAVVHFSGELSWAPALNPPALPWLNPSRHARGGG